MAEPSLRYTKADGIARLTFNRPEVRNAVDPEALCRLADAWQDIEADRDVRVVILTGAGDKAFTAGADLGTLIPLINGSRPPETEWDHRVLTERGLREIAMLREFPLYTPIIAAVNGVCVGLGAELLQATDIRIAADHARFAINEVTRGFMPGGGSAVRLAHQIPLAKVFEILLVGDPISAHEAHRIGFVNDTVPFDELAGRADELAAKIAANAPIAVRKTKETVLRTMTISYEEAWAIERTNAELTIRTEDAREGPLAFLEKRKPVFRGR
jgi:enoyl-CoA hydratase